jgi:hypothetical protein
MASPGIDSDGTVDVNLKAVSGVVPVVDLEDAQPAPGAMVHAPIDDYFGFGLLVPTVVTLGVVADTVTRFFRKCV